jgi:DNA-directed RNA polymerase specialized sigma24 family protein
MTANWSRRSWPASVKRLVRYWRAGRPACCGCAGGCSARPQAEDVAQEAALQAFLGLPRLADPARFGAWLQAIAANRARAVRLSGPR